MKRIDPFLWDDEIKEKKYSKYLDKLDRGKPVRNLFLIVVPENRQQLLSIISCRELFREDKKTEVVAVGAAQSHDGAKEMVRCLVERVYTRHGDISRQLLEEELLDGKTLDQ